MVRSIKLKRNSWFFWGKALAVTLIGLLWIANTPSTYSQTPGSAPFGFFKNKSVAGPTGGYRYYRFRALSKFGDCGYPTDGGNSGLAFRWDSTWQTNAMTSNTSGTIGGLPAQLSSSSEYSSTYSAWKMFDNLTTTDWEPASGNFTGVSPWDESSVNWVKVNFGAGNEPQITGMRIAGSYTYPDCSLDQWRLEGSANDSTWETIVGSEQNGQDVRSTSVDYTWTWGNLIAAPPNPSSPVATVESAAKISLSWTSGGGTTTSFRIAYQTGATAPANCTSGTILTSTNSPKDFLTVSGSTQYSFRICASNANSVYSSGVTVTAATTPSVTWHSGISYSTSDTVPYGGCIVPTETLMNDESTADKTTWGSETGGSTYIIADLGSIKDIRYLRVGGTGASSCWGGTGETYFPGATIEVSDNGSSWTDVTPSYAYSNQFMGNIDIGIRSNRYVRISKTGWLTTGQFRVGKPDCAGKLVAGSTACWYLASSSADSCSTVCSTKGGYHNDTKDFAGSSGTNANCAAVAQAVESLGSPPAINTENLTGIGCSAYSFSYSRDIVATTSGATSAPEKRYCGCAN